MGEKLRVTVVIDKEGDAEVVAWLGKQRNMSAAILECLKATIIAPREPGLDLAAIRRVMDAALDAKLAGLAVSTNNHAPQAVNSEMDDRLDAMFPDDGG